MSALSLVASFQGSMRRSLGCGAGWRMRARNTKGRVLCLIFMVLWAVRCRTTGIQEQQQLWWGAEKMKEKWRSAPLIPRRGVRWQQQDPRCPGSLVLNQARRKVLCGRVLRQRWLSLAIFLVIMMSYLPGGGQLMSFQSLG